MSTAPDPLWVSLVGPVIGFLAVAVASLVGYWAGGRTQKVELALRRLDGLDAYWRIGSESSGLENELEAYLMERDIGGAEYDPALARQHLESSLWFWGLSQLYKREFAHDAGGHWYYVSPDADLALANSAYLIWWLAPYALVEESIVVGQIAQQERWLAPFVLWLRTDRSGMALFAVWREWAEKCKCSSVEEQSGCDVHRMIKACSEFWRMLELSEEIVPWYKGMAGGKYLDPKELYAERR